MQGKMKVAWLKGLHRFDIVDVDIPQIGPDQVLVKILKVGICGSDRGMWNGHHFFNDLHPWEDFGPGEHGHEASGVVVEVGSEVRGVHEGDLVCRCNLLSSRDLDMRCFAEYAVADGPIVVHGADPEVVCFADPVVVALNHTYHANVQPGDTVLVMGQGFIGLLCTQLLRQHHVNVVATEIRDHKLALAERFGAVAIDARKPDWMDQVRDTAPSIDAVIECTGADAPIEAACKLVRRGGTLVIMGATRKTVTLNYTQLRIRGATVKFPMNGVNLKDNWSTAAEILHRGEIEVKSLISKRDRLVNLQSILEHYEDDWLRVVLEP